MSRARTLLVAGNDTFLDGVVAWMADDARIDVIGRAHSGSEALERIDALRVDLVLMDVSLPDLSGFEVARRIKSRPSAPLVVLLSFYDSRVARLESWAAGADGFVPTSEMAECLRPLVGDLLRPKNVRVREQVPVDSTMPAKPREDSE
ncbi:MAG TPA: response regulator transcription factor [Candidatus Polarisedimenticolaceae bacterium]